jgi:preprotein translocase subunit SecG
MLKTLYIVQLIISVALIISILLQNKGTGLSATFGGDFSGFHTKRGIERFLTIATTILGGLFIINAIVIFILSTAF